MLIIYKNYSKKNIFPTKIVIFKTFINTIIILVFGGYPINNDNDTKISDLKNIVKTFSDERDWDQYHNAKDLAIGIVTESSELLQIFRFKSEKQIDEMFENQIKRKEICHEISDTFYFLIRLAQRYDIDLTTELREKMTKNEIKYPIEKSKGSNKKYSEFKNVSL